MPRLLLDTHAFAWWLSDVSRLVAGARAAIADPRNDVFVSAITGWEIAVKRAKGKMTAPDNLSTIVDERGFRHLPLTMRHAERAGDLPVHHQDPFDRFLIAQAQTEGARPCHPIRPHPTLRRPHLDSLSSGLSRGLAKLTTRPKVQQISDINLNSLRRGHTA